MLGLWNVRMSDFNSWGFLVVSSRWVFVGESTMRMHERMEPQCHRYPSQTSGPNLPWEFSRKIPPGAPEGWHVSGVEIFQGPRLFVTFFDFDTVDGQPEIRREVTS